MNHTSRAIGRLKEEEEARLCHPYLYVESTDSQIYIVVYISILRFPYSNIINFYTFGTKLRTRKKVARMIIPPENTAALRLM